jgi:AGZA family xanthine/uracil permease-like MFS transporter
VVTAIAMPLTFSIAHGMGIGFITYVAVKVLSGKGAECPPAVYVIALLFALKFSLL